MSVADETAVVEDEAVSTPDPPTSPSSVRIKGFVAGTASGLTKLAIGHPFDTIKLRVQCSPPGVYRGPLDCLLQTIKKEGPLAVYKGASPPAVGWAISDSVLLGSLHNYRLFLAQREAHARDPSASLRRDSGEPKELSLLGHGIAGLWAGWTVCLVVTPIEVLKAKLQMQTNNAQKLYTGPIDCTMQIIRANGPQGLWRGFGGNILFRSWFGAMFASYDIILSYCRNSTNLSTGTANFLAGGLSSNVFWLGSFPFDSVKNRLMSDSITAPRYPTWMSAARQIWKEGGVRAFYRGFLPAILRAFPTNASAIFVWETSMRMMKAEQVR